MPIKFNRQAEGLSFDNMVDALMYYIENGNVKGVDMFCLGDYVLPIKSIGDSSLPDFIFSRESHDLFSTTFTSATWKKLNDSARKSFIEGLENNCPEKFKGVLD